MTSHTREAVADIARSWLGTPYHHAARIKGVGVDCAYLAVEVYAAAGLMPRIDLGDYPQQWMLHETRERYLEVVLEHAKEVQAPGVGDLIVMRYFRTFSHGSILVAPGKIVHAYINRGVQLADLEEFEGRRMRFFTLFGAQR